MTARLRASRYVGAVLLRRLVFAVFAVLIVVPGATAETRLQQYLDLALVVRLFPDADRIGRLEGAPPAATAYSGDRLLGYVFLNTDVVSSIGYSGKPIDIVIGLDTAGTITGAVLVKHAEPIVLVGIPERRVVAFVDGYAGTAAATFASAAIREAAPVDIVSGATVTIMVIDDSIKRATLKVARSRGLGGLAAPAVAAAAARTIDTNLSDLNDWPTLLGDGSVRRLSLSIADINRGFAEGGNAEAAARPESGEPDAPFIDLFIAPATIPTIGRSLLGDAEYALLRQRLKPGQQAIVVAGRGRYSFKGSGYVRGGIFDRIQLIQGENGVRFRDRDHKRLGGIEASGAPDLGEVGLFVLPDDAVFDPAQPWRLQVLVQRPIGAIQKAFLTYGLSYIPPERYLTRPALPVAASVAGHR